MKNIEKLTLESIQEESIIFSYILHFSKTLKVLNLQNIHQIQLKYLIKNWEHLE